MLKHHRRKLLFFYSFPHVSNFALLLFISFYWALTNQIIHPVTGSGRVEGAVKFDYSLRVAAQYGNIVRPF